MRTYEHESTHVHNQKEAEEHLRLYLIGKATYDLHNMPEPGEWHVVGWLSFPQENEPYVVNVTKEEMDKIIADELDKRSYYGVIGGIKPTSSDLVKLDNGEYLFNHCGKYRSNLTFVGKDIRDWKPTSASWQDFNVEPDGSLSVLRGDFFKSRKGTNCFRPKANGTHVLIMVDWGGCFNRSRGNCPFPTDIYHRRASSNGGGTGMSYWIIPFGWKRQLSIDDI